MERFAQLPDEMFPLSNESLCTGFTNSEGYFEMKSKLKREKAPLLFFLEVSKQISLIPWVCCLFIFGCSSGSPLSRERFGFPASPELSVPQRGAAGQKLGSISMGSPGATPGEAPASPCTEQWCSAPCSSCCIPGLLRAVALKQFMQKAIPTFPNRYRLLIKC